MSTHPNILIIIVTWNKKDYVINLLESLSGINYPNDKMNIVVVDNASEDGTVSSLKQNFPQVTILENEQNLGGTGGFNTGLDWAFSHQQRYDYFWLLDNDVVVHQNALSALVKILEDNADIAIAGSTMMQLDYPWRVNEMGAFIDRASGNLVLNRHMEEIANWQGKSMAELLQMDVSLADQLMHCNELMDVDYVAAASLLIRSDVAKEAGLWMDFFIHYDDVEWCMRIAKMGHRIVVSAQSLIWHLSAAAKVPTWILYYDNRNILYLIEKHQGSHAVLGAVKWIKKKSLYYTLIGKRDLAQLHIEAVTDYKHAVMGKKEISLQNIPSNYVEFSEVFEDKSIQSVLIPWTVNLQAAKCQTQLAKVLKKRNDLKIFCLVTSSIYPNYHVPGIIPIHVSGNGLLRYLKYFKLRGKFDLVFQSDYQPILPLSWIAKKILFVNDENFCLRQRSSVNQVFSMAKQLWRLNV